jgi:hypothetical protein
MFTRRGILSEQEILKIQDSVVYSWYDMLACQHPPRSFRARAYFRKYCSPTRRFSRKFGLNLEIMLLGGSSGTAASKFGKVWMSCFRNSSNSEYRLRMLIFEPYPTIG